MKKVLIAAAALCICCALPVLAQDTAHPKNEISKVEKDRKDNKTVKQVTPDPKKSPGKHADNLSKNVNHETNRESKNVNKTGRKDAHALSHARHTDHTVRQVTPSPNKSPGKHADNLSKNVNHETNRMSKDVNHAFQGKKKSSDTKTHKTTDTKSNKTSSSN
jgi:hypothetical protein